FGCQVGRWTAAEISKLEPDLTANGIALVGIGPEETGLKEFKEGGFFKDLYIDEKGSGLQKAKAQGIQGNFTGDLLQSGGMFIVAKGEPLMPATKLIIDRMGLFSLRLHFLFLQQAPGGRCCRQSQIILQFPKTPPPPPPL
ncbi:unnamed protein product, partial [Coregonus sp. 'balchen']